MQNNKNITRKQRIERLSQVNHQRDEDLDAKEFAMRLFARKKLVSTLTSEEEIKNVANRNIEHLRREKRRLQLVDPIETLIAKKKIKFMNLIFKEKSKRI